ncbi:MAG TPA: hypothetical protein VJ866_20555 [Pyrinomonadaceae bacterium]|nr:hypothetical protein [Pyrinomonadaceae bacterium]
MTNRIWQSFLLALCVCLLSVPAGVAAQTAGDRVLVEGKQQLRQSDVDGMVKFYEWALDAKFNAAQREKFQTLTEADFRRDPAASRKGIDDLLAMGAKVEALDESRRREVRETFAADFVKHLRETPGDETAKLLLGIYDARGGSSQTEAAAAGSDVEGAGGEASGVGVGDISALVGKWVWARTGSTTWNQGGGYVGGNGSRFTYQFAPGGAVEYTGIMNVMAGGCSQQVFMSKKGRARLSGDKLTIAWAPATTTRDFSCDRANNYTKTLPAETETLTVNFKNSYGQRKLCTVSKDGGETCFSPAE